MHVYYAVLSWEGYDIYLAATEDGLCFICTGTEGKKELENWQEKYFLKRRLLRDDNKLEKYITEINDYLLGKTKIFKSPIQLCGTDFQKKSVERIAKNSFWGGSYIYGHCHHIKPAPSSTGCGKRNWKKPVIVYRPMSSGHS